MREISIRIVLVAFGLIAFIQQAFGQVDVNLAQGLEPYKTYMGGDIDSVSLTNGNLMLHIPLFSYPQRGGRLNLGFYLRYNAKGLRLQLIGTSRYSWAFDGVGVDVQRYQLTEPLTQRAQHQVPGDNGTATFFVSTSSTVTADGSVHSGAWFGDGKNAGSGPYDGSALGRHGIVDSINGAVQYPNGANCNDPTGTWFPVISTDPNGNNITTTNQGWKDTLGRLIPGEPGCAILNTGESHKGIYAGGDGTGVAAIRMLPGVGTTNFSGCPANTVGARSWVVPAFGDSSSPVSSATATMKLCYANFIVSSNFGSGGTDLSAAPYTMLQNFILPNGTMWSFNYSSTGDLISVTLPTGGSISYTWANFSFCSGMSRVITSRTVNDDTGSHQWIYSWTPGVWTNHNAPPPPTTLVIRDPDGNESQHISQSEGMCAYYETDAAFFKGAVGSGTRLKQVHTDYITFADPTSLYSGSTATGAAFPSVITTTLDNGLVTKKQITYDTPTSYTDYNLLCYNCADMPLATTETRINGQVTGETVFGYGSQNPGPPLRTTSTNFFTLDDPSSVTVYDGSGNKCSETDFAYDGPNSLVSTTITQSHGAPYSGAVRANPSSVTRWLSAAPCSPNASWTPITTSATYFDTGEIASYKDALNNTTSYSYSPSFYGAYVTQTQYPDTTTAATVVHHVINGDYDFNTGLLRTFTDQNGQNSTYLFDNMLRLTTANYPDGGQVLFNYPDANTVEKKTLQSGTTFIDQFVYFDALARNKKTQLKDPEGDVFVDTGYDGLGRVFTVTNPHRSVSAATDGTTTYQYDALSRQIQVAPPDGTVPTPGGTCLSNNLCTQYSGNQTTVTDQTGKQKRSSSDALGRLVEVDEPTLSAIPNQNDHATMQTDGNFVIYNPQGTPLWATGTAGSGGSSIEIQDDGNFVLYIEKWQAGTYATPSPGPFPVQTCSIGTALNTSQTLQSNQCIVSPRGQYMLYMAPNGNFYIYDIAHNVATWSANTYNHPGAYAVMQGDGNFCIYAANGTFLWMSGTNGTLAQRLEMEDDGRIIIFRSAWDSETSQGWSTTSMAHPACDVGFGTGWTGTLGTGQCFVSPNGRYEVIMQTDGDLAIYDLSVSPANRIWHTGTALSPVDTSVALRTLYSYDPLGNLLCVEQHGTTSGTGCSSPPSSDSTSPWRVRRFTYDSLSRLLTAHNPESGTISYQYDNESNLVLKTDARGVMVNYSPIDALHRVRMKTYSDGTPSVSYGYDLGCCGVNPLYGIGRMTYATAGNTELVYVFDQMGRIKTQFDCPPSGITRGSCYSISAGYDSTGEMTSLTYPDGRLLNMAYNYAGRQTGVTLTRFNSTQVNFTYYSVPQTQSPGSWGYWPTGAMNRGNFGNGVIETTGYNNRLQINSIIDAKAGSSLFSKSYGYYDSSNHNNGNILSIVDGLDHTKDQTYTYDALNRIATAVQADNGFNITYSIDAWGNMHESGTSNFNQPFDTTNYNNRIQQPPSCSPNIAPYCYDAAGDLLNDGAHIYAYDGESRTKSVDGAGATYTYNPLGNRVRKDTSTNGSTEYFFFGGNIIAELNPATSAWTDYVFGYGKRLVKDTSNNGTGAQYYHQDHLGSARVMTDASGTVISKCGYGPYGEQVTCSPDTPANHYRFTSKERDTESGLDDFGARSYGSMIGRFTQADPLYLELHRLSDPQQLNLYTYSRNNPINLVDFLGLDIICDGSRCADYLKALQTSVSFKLTIDQKGKVGVDGDIDKKHLSKSEKEILKAIGDDKHHVAIHAIDGAKDATVSFGRSDSPHAGSHTIAFGQLALLDNPNNAGGLTSAQVVGHETLEGYAEAQGNSLGVAHNYANSFFGGLESGGKVESYGVQNGMVVQVTGIMEVHGSSTAERITLHFETPIPQKDFLKGKGAPYPQYPVAVEAVEKKK